MPAAPGSPIASPPVLAFTSHHHSPLLGVLMVTAVVAMVAWALQLMQAAADRKEFSLMLAGCMVCSAAVGLATVMVLTLTGPDRLEARGLDLASGPARFDQGAGISLDAISLPWDGLDAPR